MSTRIIELKKDILDMTDFYDIFISYRRLDAQGNISGRDQARLIAKQLELEGYHPFFDYSEYSSLGYPFVFF